jgi:hypothetical protein
VAVINARLSERIRSRFKFRGNRPCERHPGGRTSSRKFSLSGDPAFVFNSLFSKSTFLMLVFSLSSGCSVDLSSSTPGASTTGACGSASTQALADIQPIVESFLKTSCAGCHGVTSGTVQTGFFTPNASSNSSDPAVQQFAYTQLCARGGKAVSTKIAPGNGHGGGSFSNAAFDSYLNKYF